jgi:two-component system, cell cycle response regulator
VCRRLKSAAATCHLPVIMLTALDQPGDRVRGLQSGADDFLTKPLDEIALLARVRSLLRLKHVVDELRGRAIGSRDLGMGDALLAAAAETGQGGSILVIEDRPQAAARFVEALGADHAVTMESDPQAALFEAAEADYDVALVSLDLEGFDGLRLCAQFRALERTRQLQIVMLAEAEDRGRILRGLEIGAHDYIVRPVDRNELVARVRTQIRRKRYSTRLRDAVQASLAMAVVDPLTGLNNRRFLDTHFEAMFGEASRRGRPLAVLILDVDRFKAINDAYGHDVGDDVLREFAQRVRTCVRGVDLACRFGGEEIVVVMPDTGLEGARLVAERVRDKVEARPFTVKGSVALSVTVSIGVATLQPDDASQFDLLRRADDALYRAKSNGRNLVVAA